VDTRRTEIGRSQPESDPEEQALRIALLTITDVRFMVLLKSRGRPSVHRPAGGLASRCRASGGLTIARTTSLPANAYKPLAPGEAYLPLVPSASAPPEVTTRSVGWGLFLCAIFTVATCYSALKVGQGMEAAIPISILAIGLARMYKRRSTILENVIITAIGGVAGALASGAVFTLPALYMLKLDPHPLQTIALGLLLPGVAGAVEFLEDPGLFLRRDADAGVRDFNDDGFAVRLGMHGDRAARGRVLDGIEQ
jgi:hypothetical protein